ncbi:MAG: dienelactone hydrolase family protein [Chitinophagaceae bacterium]|nr:dienelactone hydrolase family protein [Chitinophagaceae bacterium]
MHKQNLISTGSPLNPDTPVLIMLHGRGADAADILGLASHLHVDGFTLLAPEATNNTWYPYSFLSPTTENEPWLTSALNLVQGIVTMVKGQGVPASNIYLLGFSQGACLTLEFSARNADRYGGIVAFTGGLIGDKVDTSNYKGDFGKTPIFIGTSDPDPHIPVPRVEESAKVLEQMNGQVMKEIYKNMGHTITTEEIDSVNSFIFQKPLHSL